MICLTFDTDHMRRDDLQRFFEEIPFPGNGTVFLVAPFPEKRRYDHEFEPHPFFEGNAGWGQELEACVKRLELDPSGCRPHSCVYSHMLGLALHNLGYRYVSQATPLYQDGLQPFRHPWGIWEMPIYYMDNMDICMGVNWPELEHRPFHRDVIRRAVASEALFVFDFHPLHIALNTSDFHEYQRVKGKVVHEGRSPFALRAAGRGSATFFEELCQAMQDQGLRSVTCLHALDAFIEQFSMDVPAETRKAGTGPAAGAGGRDQGVKILRTNP